MGIPQVYPYDLGNPKDSTEFFGICEQLTINPYVILEERESKRHDSRFYKPVSVAECPKTKKSMFTRSRPEQPHTTKLSNVIFCTAIFFAKAREHLKNLNSRELGVLKDAVICIRSRFLHHKEEETQLRKLSYLIEQLNEVIALSDGASQSAANKRLQEINDKIKMAEAKQREIKAIVAENLAKLSREKEESVQKPFVLTSPSFGKEWNAVLERLAKGDDTDFPKDCSIVCKNGDLLDFHSIVLRNISALAARLDGKWQENGLSESDQKGLALDVEPKKYCIPLKEYSKECLQLLHDFLYGRLKATEISDTLLLEFFVLSNNLAWQTGEDICTEAIKNRCKGNGERQVDLILEFFRSNPVNHPLTDVLLEQILPSTSLHRKWLLFNVSKERMKIFEECILKAAAGGSKAAKLLVTQFHETGLCGYEIDNVIGVKILTSKELSDYPPAICSLSIRLKLGLGVASNIAKAIKILEKIVNIYPPAEAELAAALAKRTQLDNSLLELYLAAEKKGPRDLSDFASDLAKEKDSDDSLLKDFRSSLKGGNPKALSNLASGLAKRVDSDNSQIMELYQLAAKEGCPHALCDLGVIYKKGLFKVEIDLVSAVKYFNAAAEQGYAFANAELGNIQMMKEPTNALKNFEKAAYAGCIQGMLGKAKFYADGIGEVPKNPSEAIEIYAQAYRFGSALAAFKIGQLFETNENVRDNSKAIEWYTNSKELGSLDANKALSRLKSRAREEQPLYY